MTALLVAAAAIAGTGAIAALAPGDVRLGLIGLTASLVGAAFLADPLPGPAVLAIRLAALLLTVVTLRTAAPKVTRRATGERGWSVREPHAEAGEPRPGWPAQVLLGVAGLVAGVAIASRLVLGPVTGGDVGQPAVIAPADLLSPQHLAFGVAGLMLAIALGPLMVDRTGLRRAIAAVLGVQAAMLLRIAFVPAPGVFEEVVLGTILVGVAAAGAMLTVAGRATPPARAASEDRSAPGTDSGLTATPGRRP